MTEDELRAEHERLEIETMLYRAAIEERRRENRALKSTLALLRKMGHA